MKITRAFLKKVLVQKEKISKLELHAKTLYIEEEYQDCLWQIETEKWHLNVMWNDWKNSQEHENNVYDKARAVRELVDSCCELQKGKITPENTLILEKILMLVSVEVE